MEGRDFCNSHSVRYQRHNAYKSAAIDEYEVKYYAVCTGKYGCKI